MSGLDVVQALSTRVPNARTLVLTGFGSIATALDAIKMGAVSYLTKPADTDEILAAFNSESSATSPDSVPSLDRVEWEHIQRVLHEFNNNISQAARALGIHRRTLQRKLSKYPPNR
jgi:two-component system response regulator RegA